MSKKEACCSVEITLRVIGGRWKVLIIRSLLNGTMRFNQLQRDLADITHRTLSRQLREMEADQLIVRNDFNEIPPHVEYSLSTLGHSLKTILYAMDEWGKNYDAGGDKIKEMLINSTNELKHEAHETQEAIYISNIDDNANAVQHSDSLA